MKMTNITIEVRDRDYIVVCADTERFGNGEVMCECNTFDQCFDYIRRELGMNKDERVKVSSYFFYEPYTDRAGKCLPCWMKVLQ